MEMKLISSQYLICVVVLLLLQLHGYKSCIEKERVALLKLKEYLELVSEFGEAASVQPTWTNDTKIDCCHWNGVKCSLTSGRVIEISIGSVLPEENSLFDLSLFHPFEEVQSLNLSLSGLGERGFSSFFDDLEGYKSLRRLRNLEILDLISNEFNNSIFPFLNAATSLTTLYLRFNNLDGPLPVKQLKDLRNLELLDLSGNRFNGTIPFQELSTLTNLKALDLSNNEFSGFTELQGVHKLKNMQELDLSRNKLVGKIPESFSGMKNLESFDLSFNGLQGRIPSQLTELSRLAVFNVSYNNLSGVIPQGGQFNTFDIQSYLGNPLLCGKPTNRSCNSRVSLL